MLDIVLNFPKRAVHQGSYFKGWKEPQGNSHKLFEIKKTLKDSNVTQDHYTVSKWHFLSDSAMAPYAMHPKHSNKIISCAETFFVKQVFVMC